MSTIDSSSVEAIDSLSLMGEDQPLSYNTFCLGDNLYNPLTSLLNWNQYLELEKGNSHKITIVFFLIFVLS